MWFTHQNLFYLSQNYSSAPVCRVTSALLEQTNHGNPTHLDHLRKRRLLGKDAPQVENKENSKNGRIRHRTPIVASERMGIAKGWFDSR